MTEGMLIDEHVSIKQSKKAIAALHSHATKHAKQKEETELLPGKDEFVWLVLTTKKTYPEKKLKPIKVPITHPLVDPRTTPICLITKDPQREYKDLLASHNIKFISRVVGITKLKGKFKPFEARRMLLQENGMFLTDERVVPLLPGLLGKKFFEAKKQPIPVCLTRKDLKGELERAISSTYMHQNQGTCTSIKIGTLSQTPTQILDNLTRALPEIVKHVRDKWDNIQSLNIKTNSSVSLPIWSCALGQGEDSRWEEVYEDEWSGVGSSNGEGQAGKSGPSTPARNGAKSKSKKRVAEEEGVHRQKKAKQKAKAGADEDSDADETAASSLVEALNLTSNLSEQESASKPKKAKESRADKVPEESKSTKSIPKATDPASEIKSSPPQPKSLTPAELKQKKAASSLEKKKDKIAKGRLAGGTKENIVGKAVKARV